MAMDSTLTRHDNLMPQRTGGMRRGTAMALLVHVGLLIALAFGVSWRSQTPAGVSAELWAAVPQIAAPPAVEPKPVPVPTPAPPPAPKVEQAPPQPSETEAQIAIEKEKAERKLREQREQQQREQQQREQQQREQQERERKEQERKEQERIEREKAEKLAAQKQRELEIKRQKEEAKQREENLKRILGQAAGTGATQRDRHRCARSGPIGKLCRSHRRACQAQDLLDRRRGPGQPQRRRRSALRARWHHCRDQARQEQRQQGVGPGRAACARAHRRAAARRQRPRAVEHGDRFSAARVRRAVLQGAASRPRSALIGSAVSGTGAATGSA